MQVRGTYCCGCGRKRTRIRRVNIGTEYMWQGLSEMDTIPLRACPSCRHGSIARAEALCMELSAGLIKIEEVRS